MAANRVRVVCGPTAAGKSSLASSLALQYGATIISADSRQIYRGFDVGTAKPSWSERKTITHLGIDIAEPTTRFSASEWATLALGWIRSATADNLSPLVVGGTGFYVRALFDPLFEAPALDAGRRAILEHVLNAMPLDQVRRWCEALDPGRAHLGRYQLVRAIEIALLSGERISDLHARSSVRGAVHPSYLVVDPEKSLADRIERRVDAMLDAGWLDEVRALDTRVDEHAPAWKASGYQVMRRVARGEIDLSRARDRIIIETRQYAKRQRTWLRHQLGDAPVTRVNPDDAAAMEIAQRWWKESS